MAAAVIIVVVVVVVAVVVVAAAHELAIQPLVQHETIQISNTASCTTRDNTN